MKYKLFENDKVKSIRSEKYNYDFNKITGYFQRYGKTKSDEDDPTYSPIGPELLDWEISTTCNKKTAGGPCAWCYKSNNKNGKHLDYDTFKQAFSLLPNSICQIAYGIGSIDGHPDLFNILNYTREHNVIPNLTINGEATNDEIAELANVLGGISVSHYNDDVCYDTVQKLIKETKREDSTLYQVCIHQLLAEETLDECFKVIDDMTSDERLDGLHALIFLTLKPKGKRNTYSSVSYEQFSGLISYAQKCGVRFGMDSCAGPMMIRHTIDKNQPELMEVIEPCESGIFSSYLDVDCNYFPCSFSANEGEWEEGISVLGCEDFVKDIWYNDRVVNYRNMMLGMTNGCDCKFKSQCRFCPVFDITPCAPRE